MIPHKTLTAIAVVDGAIAFGVLAWSGLSLIAQVVPPVSSGWQAIGFIAVVALQAWSMYLQSKQNAAVKDKVETVHAALNGQLAAFKEDAARASQKMLMDAVDLVKAQNERDIGTRVAAFEARIAKLDVLLVAAETRATTLAAVKLAKDAIPGSPK